MQSAKASGISHLTATDDCYDGRVITVKGSKLLNFGSYSYMGLETDPRLKQAAVQAILQYGIQYPSSRAYVSSVLYSELENLVQQMYEAPIVLAGSLSIGHHGVMPVVVEEGDAVILDQQVHSSVQDAARKLQLNGVSLTIVRHNHLEELKKKIEELAPRHEKIWYMCDGVYSMYGDVAPVKELVELANQYKQLYLYIDDAHGMSSFGKNGTGYVMSRTELHPKMILCTGMAKAFGTMGAIYVIPDKELATKIRNCTGPLIFSGQMATSILGASIESAKIHLSGEITVRQNFLAEKINYCHRLLRKYNLPDISDPDSPIFFIGLGMMSVAMNLVKRMMGEGFYVNIAIFPAVPETCSGIRFTITLHLSLEDIERMVAALAKHFPLALKEEGRSIKDIQRAFRKVAALDFLMETEKEEKGNEQEPLGYKVQQERTIKNIDKIVWDKLLGHRGEFSWNNLLMMEESFRDNPKKEDNWQFYYYIIFDPQGKPLLVTFFTIGWCKDDMLAPAAVSEKIEHTRTTDPSYLTSRALIMGSVVTSGQQLYLDRSYAKWQEVLMLLLDKVMELQEKEGTELILIRDFIAGDKELSDFFISHAFIETALPDTHRINELNWESQEDFLGQVSRHRRQYLKQKVFKYESDFEVEICHQDTSQLDCWYRLYENVSKRSLEVNTFKLPEKFFLKISAHPDWEMIQLRLKSDTREGRPPVAVMFCYKGMESYAPLFVGMDYDFLEHNIYPQILWQTLKRAKELKLAPVHLGFTASQNKQKFGAKAISQMGFVQMKDHYKMTLIGLMPNESR